MEIKKEYYRVHRALEVEPHNKMQFSVISRTPFSGKSNCPTRSIKRDKGCGRTNHGYFIMTMHLLKMPLASGSSYLRGTLPYWNNFPIHLIMLQMTFSFSQNSRRSSTMELRSIPEESYQQKH